MPTDYAAFAAETAREVFVAACPFGFLVGRTPPPSPARQHMTISLRHPFAAEKTEAGQPKPPSATATLLRTPLLVLAVRKVQDAFPNMITVGRTPNNDVVIDDLSISKFHAYFRVTDDNKVELCDAGSRNGTWIGDLQLALKEPVAVRSGEAVRLGQVTFRFLAAGDAWDRLRREKR